MLADYHVRGERDEATPKGLEQSNNVNYSQEELETYSIPVTELKSSSLAICHLLLEKAFHNTFLSNISFSTTFLDVL